jgi:GNAT superfamily N-acetyltransferase
VPSAVSKLPAGVLVRRARPGDAAAVFRLVQQLGYQPGERGFDETFAQVVRHPEAAVFVATEGLRVLGYLALSQRPQIRLGGRAAAIDELVIDDTRRGEGLGTALLEAALDHARALRCVRVEVSTRRTRESYQRGFYLSHGFREVDSAALRLDPLPAPPSRPIKL